MLKDVRTLSMSSDGIVPVKLFSSNSYAEAKKKLNNDDGNSGVTQKKVEIKENTGNFFFCEAIKNSER